MVWWRQKKQTIERCVSRSLCTFLSINKQSIASSTSSFLLSTISRRPSFRSRSRCVIFLSTRLFLCERRLQNKKWSRRERTEKRKRDLYTCLVRSYPAPSKRLYSTSCSLPSFILIWYLSIHFSLPSFFVHRKGKRKAMGKEVRWCGMKRYVHLVYYHH